MNTTKIIGLLILLFVIIGVYVSVTGSNSVNDQQEMMVENEVQTEQEKMDIATEQDDVMMNDDTAHSPDTMMDEAGTYTTYSSNKLAMATEGDVVLFFKASWCPSCRSLDSDIKKNISDIPAGVTILEVDYDNSTDLRKKYGVTQQHSLVQVDTNGNQIAKWSGSPTLETVLNKIQ